MSRLITFACYSLFVCKIRFAIGFCSDCGAVYLLKPFKLTLAAIKTPHQHQSFSWTRPTVSLNCKFRFATTAAAPPPPQTAKFVITSNNIWRTQ